MLALAGAGQLGADDTNDADNAPISAGDGLVATYFDNKDRTDPRFQRVDPAVDFD